MKRVIVTVYQNLKHEDEISKFSDLNIQKYWDKLIENKKKYAERCDADFKLCHNTKPDYDFTEINLYKHKLMADLAEDYDEVMYVDMDVIFNTNENIFESIDLNKGIAIKDQDDEIYTKDKSDFLIKTFGKRNPTLKYYITKDLLNDKDNHVINTGIMIGKSEHILQLKFYERLSDIRKNINELKEKVYDRDHIFYIRGFYYPNNESIFSYILEKYNVPYQLLSDEWHDIRDRMSVKDKPYGKIVHAINKVFYPFFEEKKIAVYSLYVKIEDDRLDEPGTFPNDSLNKSKRTQIEMDKYRDQLIKNKQDYCNKIGADFFFYENDTKYQEFTKDYSDLSEYDIVNLYKIYLLDQLVKDYDYVMYLDFDVYCYKCVNPFHFLDCDNYLHCYYSTKEFLEINNTSKYFSSYNKNFRSPHTKYWNAYALLDMEDLDGENDVYNTGIIMASKNTMSQLKYFDDMREVIENMKELKEFSIYPPKIQKQFGYDNETIFAYKVKKNNVPTICLSDQWHYRHSPEIHSDRSVPYEIRKNIFEAKILESNPILIHFISKQFDLVFE